MIPAFHLITQATHQFVDVGCDRPAIAQGFRQHRRIPLKILATQNQHPVGIRQTFCQHVGMHAETHAVGAWLKGGDDARVSHLGAQTTQRGTDLGGVVGKIVVHRDKKHEF